MKILKLLLIFVSFLLVTSAVNAITTYGEFQNQQSSININYGQNIYFDAVLFSVNPPITYNIKMYDNNLNLVKTFVDTNTNNNFISNRYTITQADYQNNRAYTIIIQGTDNKNDQSSVTLTLNVGITANNAPILNTIGNQQVNEGQLLQFTVTATDQNSDPLTLSATNLPTGATFTDNGNGNGVFNWQTNFNNAGTYVIRFITNDGSLQDFEDVTINVIDVTGGTPIITIQAPQLNEVVSGIYNILWTATDPDQTANTLDIMIEYNYDGYLWTVLENLQDNNDGIFTWNTASLSDATDYQIRITATDNIGNTAQATVLFTVDNLFTPNINIIQPLDNSVISGTYNILWQATDVDQNPGTLDIKIEYRDPFNVNNGIFENILNFFGIQLTHWITLEDLQDNNDGTFTWNTRNVQDATYQLRITAKDDNNNIATGFVNSFMINNAASNNLPVITSAPGLKGIVNQIYSYDVDATDLDNDPLTYSLLTYPQGMSIDVNTGLISWIPSAKGNYNIVVQVRDNFNGIAQQSFTINVVTQIFTLTGKEFAEKHDFMISNLILKENGNDLNILVNLDNQGNNREGIQLIVTDLNTNRRIQDSNFDLSINEGTWRLMTLKNIERGRHVIKVEAISKAFKDSKYGFTYIN
ncbi:MAG: putative Ig domain-containing protein [Nanoarchaeota archaeon]